MSRPTVHILRAGLTTYQQGLRLQQLFTSRFNEKTENEFESFLILTEHKPVYTIGIRTKDYTIDDEEKLRKLGADFFRTNRGGLITFHGPGQIVAYPILNLKQFKPSVRWYVCHLEKTIISLCDELGLRATTSQDTGVWIGNEKICAMGIHAKRYITSHGLALNCDVDLSWFDHIVPCGLPGKGVTSLSKQLGKRISFESAAPLMLSHFERTFNCNVKNCSANETRDYLSQVGILQPI